MKRTAIAVILLGFSAALATTAFAQGRHDEKPHGSTKPSASSTEGLAPVAISGGRHDERPHGPRKPAASPKAQKGEGAAAGEKPAK